MKEMKKIICVLLAGAMVMGLCACGSKGSGKSHRDDDDDRDSRTERTKDDDDDEDDDDDRGRNRRSDDDDADENKGRKYYEEGGSDGEEYYYLIDDKTPDEIVELYVYYCEAVDEVGLDYREKFRDYLLAEPKSYDTGDDDKLDIDYSYRFYDPIDHITTIYLKEDPFQHVECTMEFDIYDLDRADAIMQSFVDYYNVGDAEVKDYDGQGFYTKGYMIKIGYEHTYFVTYKEKESSKGVTYYEVRFSESKHL